MRSAGTSGDVSDILKRLFAVMPKAKSDSAMFAETWLAMLHNQPLASIYAAFLHFVRDPKRQFAPTVGEFLEVVEQHAATVRLKADHLREAINGEKS